MKIKVSSKRQTVCGTIIADPVVTVGGKSIVADQHIPGDLARLVPARWGNAPASAWAPFVARAIAMGRL